MKVLSVQDISCVGQCSLTVALPILSACGVETAILPTALLSTHTAGFRDFTCLDLTEEMPKIVSHWQKEGITFDAVYTGYLGSAGQIDTVLSLAKTLLKGNLIVDPAMADNGKLYPAFDRAYVQEMKRLAFASNILLPNLTEACLLADIEYQEQYDEAYIRHLLETLCAKGAPCVVLTGVSYDEETTGVAVYEKGAFSYYRHKKYAKGCHGTGDVYASAFVGALQNGKSVVEASCIAADYTLSCIEHTQGDASHWYGVKFEEVLPKLIEKLK